MKWISILEQAYHSVLPKEEKKNNRKMDIH